MNNLVSVIIPYYKKKKLHKKMLRICLQSII